MSSGVGCKPNPRLGRLLPGLVVNLSCRPGCPDKTLLDLGSPSTDSGGQNMSSPSLPLDHGWVPSQEKRATLSLPHRTVVPRHMGSLVWVPYTTKQEKPSERVPGCSGTMTPDVFRLITHSNLHIKNRECHLFYSESRRSTGNFVGNNGGRCL